MQTDDQKVLEAAYAKGYAFGKYTQDIPLDNEIIELLENSDRLMKDFLIEFNRSARQAMILTIRG